ncbi:MAG: FAD-binding oxidoreductase [Marinicaulis sp.]|nr:FAD-binding oxidoreductase [Marinicaulis sp.]
MNAGILIIGAGIQGASIALELAHRGRAVTLIERDTLPMNRASLRNEGKIHLGLIYAADLTFRTADLQLKGALSFFPLMKRWLGDRKIGLSTPFQYFVARDSLMTPDKLGAHYEKLSRQCSALLHDFPSLGYEGLASHQLAEKIDTPANINPDLVEAVFDTCEIAVNTDELAAAYRDAIDAHPLIDFHSGIICNGLERSATGMRAQCEGYDGAELTIDAEQIVNCTWEDRMRLDATLGIEPTPGLLHRLKYRTIAKLPEQMLGTPSVTIVLGAYGDIVIRNDGLAYLSWYPSGCQGWTHDIAPPGEWNLPCRGKPDPEMALKIHTEALAMLSDWRFDLAEAEPLYVDAGAIVAYGKSDVDDPKSRLHDRTRIGVFGGGDYFSVDPGKLTTGPLFAMAAADQITGDCADEQMSALLTT